MSEVKITKDTMSVDVEDQAPQRMLNPGEQKEKYLLSIPKLEDIKSTLKFEVDEETKNNALIRVLDYGDSFIESLTTSCCTYEPIKELKMRERAAKVLKTFQEADKMTIKLIGETQIAIMLIQADVVEMYYRYGGDSQFILRNGTVLIKTVASLLEFYRDNPKGLYTKNQGKIGEIVYCVNIDVLFRNRRGFKITSLHHGILKSPEQTFTISSLWPESNQAKIFKENSTFEKLVEETKLIELGILSESRVIKYSKTGKEWLARMALKYKW